jgi:hypothetical protein
MKVRNHFYSKLAMMVTMKATIDIPDELYRRVKAKSALEGRRIREVTIELYSSWVDGAPSGSPQTGGEWLETWLRVADEALAGVPAGPSARQILAQDRGRLDDPSAGE